MWSSYAVEAILTLIVVAVIIYLWTLCHPPRGFAPGLPVIPIWVSLLPLIRSRLGKPLLPQDEVYIRYHRIPIEQKGAVVIFFGGRWNVLVARPCAVRAFFTHEKDLYHKSGNHLKLPNAVISQLTGGNIISEHGEVSPSFRIWLITQKWKRYASVIRPAIKSKINHDGANEATRRLSRHLDELKGVVSMVPLVQRFAMENVALSVFQRDLGVSHSTYVSRLTISSCQIPYLISTKSTLRSRNTSSILCFSAFLNWTTTRQSSPLVLLLGIVSELWKRRCFETLAAQRLRSAPEVVRSVEAILPWRQAWKRIQTSRQFCTLSRKHICLAHGPSENTTTISRVRIASFTLH